MIHRYIKKSLNLLGVQIHGQYTVRAWETSRLATSFDVIGTRGWSLRSWRA